MTMTTKPDGRKRNGGARPGAGKPPATNKTGATPVDLSPEERKIAMRLGGGKIAAGVRKALHFAAEFGIVEPIMTRTSPVDALDLSLSQKAALDRLISGGMKFYESAPSGLDVQWIEFDLQGRAVVLGFKDTANDPECAKQKQPIGSTGNPLDSCHMTGSGLRVLVSLHPESENTAG